MKKNMEQIYEDFFIYFLNVQIYKEIKEAFFNLFHLC